MLELLKAAKKAAITAKVIYVRNRNKRNEYLCLVFTDTILDENELSDDKINELVDTFMSTLPALLKTQLQAA